MAKARVYLDNAATSFPKPPGVLKAMARYATELGASPGRGAYRESVEAGRVIARCRERVCRLIGASTPEQIVFGHNATEALNLAIKGVIRHRLRRRGRAHAVASAMEHNSILRPLNALRAEGLEWTCIPCDARTGLVDPDNVTRAIRGDTALVAIAHGSNVTGTIQPIKAIGRACRERSVYFLVDAAQTLGHFPVDAAWMDLLAFPGHKGLLGPLGTGGLYIQPGVEGELEPLVEGGTGSRSEQDTQPDEMPDRYESGSHNTIGLAGLGEGVAFVLDEGIDAIRAHERALADRLVAELSAMSPRVRVVGPAAGQERLGVVSITHESLGAQELAIMLEQRGVLARAGLHCAPRAHAALGTLEGGGTTRLSTGPCTTMDDVGRAVAAVRASLGGMETRSTKLEARNTRECRRLEKRI